MSTVDDEIDAMIMSVLTGDLCSYELNELCVELFIVMHVLDMRPLDHQTTGLKDALFTMLIMTPDRAGKIEYVNRWRSTFDVISNA